MYYRPDWPEKRQQRLEIDGHKCKGCNRGSDEVRLEVHHRTYERTKPSGDGELMEDLVTLCWQCHEAITDVRRKLRYENREAPEAVTVESPAIPFVMENSSNDVEIPQVTFVRRDANPAQRSARRPSESLFEGAEGGEW